VNKDPELMELIRPIQDPELFISIVELGLVYGVERVDAETVRAQITLTSPGCPLGPQIMSEMEKILKEKIPEIKTVTVELVWDPPWDPKINCSEDAKMMLGIF